MTTRNHANRKAEPRALVPSRQKGPLGKCGADPASSPESGSGQPTPGLPLVSASPTGRRRNPFGHPVLTQSPQGEGRSRRQGSPCTFWITDTHEKSPSSGGSRQLWALPQDVCGCYIWDGGDREPQLASSDRRPLASAHPSVSQGAPCRPSSIAAPTSAYTPAQTFLERLRTLHKEQSATLQSLAPSPEAVFPLPETRPLATSCQARSVQEPTGPRPIPAGPSLGGTWISRGLVKTQLLTQQVRLGCDSAFFNFFFLS